MLARPAKVYDFTAFARRQPTTPPPGDRIDAQLQNHADAIAATQHAVEKLIAAQTAVRDLDIKALAFEVKARAEAEFGDLNRSADNAHALADQARRQLDRMFAEADRARDVADRSEARLAAAVLEAQSAPMPASNNAPVQTATSPMPLLGINTGGPYAGDKAGATATSADYAQVSIEWAEHMPDTIPPNILAINSISGDHWSSRWWANRAASAFGMLAWWYMGAWPGPPPTTPNTPTGQPIPPGAMYFDTVLGHMLVWNGSSWVPLAQGPAEATTSSLYYLATAGQTVFPLGTADLAGHIFAFNQTTTEGLHAHVNGVRVTPTADYTVNTVSSTVTFARGVSLNAVVAFDLLTSTSLLAPSGSALTVLLSPITPDGVKTVFTGLTVAATSALVNVAHNEELLVSVNGVQQQPGAAYNALGAQITFVQAPEADANVFIIWFGPSAVRSVAPPTHSSQALAYLARTVGGNEGGNGENTATLIDGLVSDGVWAKLDALYVLAQQNETDAKLNLIGTSYGLTQVGSLGKPGPRAGSIVFTQYVGFSGFNTAISYFDTGFNAATTPSPKFIQDSASLGAWLYADPAGLTNVVMGTGNVGASGESNLYPNYSGGLYVRVNNASIGEVTSPGTRGFYAGDRLSSASVTPYYNGNALTTQSGASVAPQNHNFQFGALSGGGTDATLSAAFIGASLGAAGQLALYNRLRTYMTAIGVP